MGGLDMTPAGPGDQDTVLGLLRAASSARATSGQAMWGNEFPDVVRDLPAGLVHLGLNARDFRIVDVTLRIIWHNFFRVIWHNR